MAHIDPTRGSSSTSTPPPGGNAGETAPGSPPQESTEPTRLDLLRLAATNARVRAEQRIPGLEQWIMRAAHEGFIVSEPVLSAAAGVFATGVALAKSNLLTLVATEFVVAKGVDYGLSKALRGDGKSEVFYASIARAGYEAGLRGQEVYPASVLGGLSLTNTGYVDLALGLVAGAKLRSAVFEQPAVAAALRRGLIDEEQLTSILFSATSYAAKKLKTPETLESPLTVHLLMALKGEHDPLITREANTIALVEKPMLPGVGTAAGHAVAGGAVGVALGDVSAGLLVGAIDSVLDATLTHAAFKGRLATITTLKTRSFHQGWDNRNASVGDALANLYAPAREELVKAGRDVREILELNTDALAEALDHAVENAARSGGKLALSVAAEALLPRRNDRSAFKRAASGLARHGALQAAGDELHAAFYPKGAIAQTITGLIDGVVADISASLQEEGGITLMEALRRDFPELSQVRFRALRRARSAQRGRLLDRLRPKKN